MKHPFLKKLEKFHTKNELIEKGISRDLQIIWEKVSKGEYEKGFIPVNKFDVQSRTEGIYRELEFLMQLGHDWARILKELPLNNFKNIVDLCPGYAPKIELGLYFLGFKGSITVLDIDRESIKSLKKFMNLYLPDFKMIEAEVNLFNKVKQYDLVLGNHIIDDLTVYYFCNKSGVSLNDFYSNENIALKVWKGILSKRAKNLETISQKIADILVSIIRKKGFLCLSQYKSYSEKLFNMQDSYNFNGEVFLRVKKILKNKGLVEDNKTLVKAFKGYKGHFGVKDCILLQKK